jgi:hypothetical protein
MDRLFSVSTSQTVWQSLVQKRSLEEVLAERTQANRVWDEKKEMGMEQVEEIQRNRV